MADIEHSSGFKTVHDHQPQWREAKNKVDIIAIHGIGAHVSNTWTHSKTQVHWLKDVSMLPQDILNSRIMLYGYKSNWLGQHAVKVDITDIAEPFVDRLVAAREDGQCKDRPMIFIAHCFGGIVLMKALTLMKEHRPDLLRCVVGLFFFGTPFRGVNGSLGNGELVRFAEGQNETVHPDILSILTPGNSHLREILSDFNRINNRALALPPIYCYFESMAARVQRIVDQTAQDREMVVVSESATLDIAKKRQQLERDHFALNKFEGPYDQHYKDVARDLKEVARGARDVVKERKKWKIPNTTKQRNPDTNRTFGFERIRNRAGSFDALNMRSPGVPEVRPPDTSDTGPPHALSPPSPTWQEDSMDFFNTESNSKSTILGVIPEKTRRKAQACGLSPDGTRGFLLSESWLTIFATKYTDSKGTDFILHEAPKGLNINKAKITRSFIAIIYSKHQGIGTHLRLYKIPEAKGSLEWLGRHDTDTYAFDCLALHEKPSSVLVALGRSNRTTSTPKAEIQFIEFPRSKEEPSDRCPAYPVLDLSYDKNRNKLRNHDPAHFLTFSADGCLLLCFTREKYAPRIMAWRLEHDGNNSYPLICYAVRQFTPEKEVDGITSGACWFSASGNPYMIVTTSPSTQRKENGGEWSFIAPMKIPFPLHQDNAMHCLMDAQHGKFMSIVDCAVAKKGNAIALLGTRGKICVLGLRALDNGGIGASDDALEELEKEVKISGHLQEATLSFTDDDKKLVALDIQGKLVVAEFESDSLYRTQSH